MTIFFEHRIGLVERGLGNVAEIAAGRRGIHVFGIVHRELREIGAAVEAIHQHFYFALRFGVVGRVVVFAIANLRFLARGDDDLRDAILRLGDVELRFVRVVELGDVLIGDGDFGDDFTIQEFRDRKLAAQIGFQIADRNVAIFELALKFFFGVRALQLGEFIFDFAVARFEIQFFRALEKNFVVDELIENIELERERFFLRRLLAFGVHARSIIFVDVGALDFLAVDDRPHVGPMLDVMLAAGGNEQQRARERQQNRDAAESPSSAF